MIGIVIICVPKLALYILIYRGYDYICSAIQSAVKYKRRNLTATPLTYSVPMLTHENRTFKP